MPKQPRHTRTINGRPVLVNPEMPPAKGPSGPSTAARGAQATVGGLGALASDPSDPAVGEDFHVADLRDWGLDIDVVSDDDGGGIVFNRESYLPAPISVLDTAAEDKLESDLTRLARDSGLGGIEIMGNRLQWIKVYDTEGHALGQEGYLSESDVDALEIFDDNLRTYSPTAPERNHG